MSSTTGSMEERKRGRMEAGKKEGKRNVERWYKPIILSLKKPRQENHEFKAIFGSTQSLRQLWTTKNQTNKN